MIQRYIIQVITAGLGAGGYSILFNIRRDKLPYASAGGSLAWIIYILASQTTTNAFITNMLAAAFATLYSEIFARIKKAPTTVFLIPSIMPMIPGGGLFYTMSAVINNNSELFEKYFITTIETALGISIGIMFMSLIGVKLVKKGLPGLKKNRYTGLKSSVKQKSKGGYNNE
ncbi:putative uncharacterized protein [Firmicutes bacterium CAG:882]|jgi:uncharacterized membrane protein YjjB (DUF3815 family)|nr:putative uncharacterized protein [Firmicutes bacterium CAG:882]